MSKEDLERAIRQVPDFPNPGILFFDILPLLKDRVHFANLTRELASFANSIDVVAGIAAGITTHQFLHHGIDPFLLGFDHHGGIHLVLGHLVAQVYKGRKHGHQGTQDKVRPIGQIILKDNLLNGDDVWLKFFFVVLHTISPNC